MRRCALYSVLGGQSDWDGSVFFLYYNDLEVEHSTEVRWGGKNLNRHHEFSPQKIDKLFFLFPSFQGCTTSTTL